MFNWIRRTWTFSGSLSRMRFGGLFLLAYVVGTNIVVSLSTTSASFVRKGGYIGLPVALVGLGLISLAIATLAVRRARDARVWRPPFVLLLTPLPFATISVVIHTAGAVAPNHHAWYVETFVASAVLVLAGWVCTLLLLLIPSRITRETVPTHMR